MPQNVFLKSVSEIMSEYMPVYPASHDWNDTIKVLLEDDKEIIDELQRQYLINGAFRSPVIIMKADPEDLDEESRDYVADGTHRIVAAHLLNVDSILAADSYDDFLNNDFSIETLISMSNGSQLNEDAIDIMFDNLRSFSISDDLWITTSLAASGPEGCTLFWDEDDEKIIPLINEKIRSVIDELFPKNNFVVTTECKITDDNWN